LEKRNVTFKKSLFQISYDFTYHEANVTLGFVSLKNTLFYSNSFITNLINVVDVNWSCDDSSCKDDAEQREGDGGSSATATATSLTTFVLGLVLITATSTTTATSCHLENFLSILKK
jgi:hypothetical protein